METAPQDFAAQGLSEMKPATQKITEIETGATLKKCEWVKRAKVELTRVEDHSESPTVAPGISKRGKNAKITQGPSVRATRRNAKLQECKSEQKSVQLSEVNMEVVRGECFTLNPHHRVAATKSTRGRKTNQALTKPLQAEEDVSEEQPTDGDKPDKRSPTCGRNTRGKRTKPDYVQSAAVEEMEQKSAPPARTKRGQIAKDEGKVTTQSREPVRNQRRTRNVEQDPVKPSPVLNDEQATRSRRAKKAAQEKPLAESDDVQKSVAISVMDKPKQSRRTKQVAKEMSAVVPEEKPELKADEFKEEAEATVGKRRVRNDDPEPIQAKRARRGATPAPVETNTQSPALGSMSEPSSKELPKRGRRAAKPSADVALLSGKELKTAVVEDANIPMRSVKWESDIEIFEIQKVTPVKPVQGRKSKVGDRVSTESQKEPRKTEEKDLSEKAEVQATKRARRGVRIAESIKGKHVEPEMQPKTRSGRLAKK